mgnify:CR=1 FL=1
MKRRGLIFNSRPDKAAMFALGLMLGLCPVSQAWADTNITDSQVVAQAQKKVKGQVIDATGEPLIGVNISVIAVRKELLRILMEIMRLTYLPEPN